MAPDAPPVSYADLHIHPRDDPDRARSAELFYAALLASDLAVAVLADHDEIGLAQELVARSREEKTTIELVVGEEITTRAGHVLGIGLTARVPKGMSLIDSVAAVHEQGAIAVIAHPLLPIWTAASEATLVYLAEGDLRSRPEALESMHPLAAWFPRWHGRVEALAERLGYAVVGGSDAHVTRSIGLGRTGFRGSTAADLFAAIRALETWSEGKRAPLGDIFRVDRSRG